MEGSLAARRVGELFDLGITGRFDLAHLKTLHRYIFQDVFPWAGQFRVVDISKGNSSFGPAQFLEGALTDVLWKLGQEGLLKGLAARHFADRAAFYLGEINAIHPFREGNGRTQREFIRQLGLEAGHVISWAGFTQGRMVEASIASHTKGDPSGLAGILFEAVQQGAV